MWLCILFSSLLPSVKKQVWRISTPPFFPPVAMSYLDDSASKHSPQAPSLLFQLLHSFKTLQSSLAMEEGIHMFHLGLTIQMSLILITLTSLMLTAKSSFSDQSYQLHYLWA